jgi:predicted PurR-regulated permease PerM
VSPPGPPSADRPSPAHEPAQRRGLAWCAAAAVLVIAWLAHLVAIGLFLGTLMGFALAPLHDTFRRRTRNAHLAALATVSVAAFATIGAMTGFASLFLTRSVDLTNSLVTALAPDGALGPWAGWAMDQLARVGFSSQNLTDRLRDVATSIASRSASFAAAGASATVSTLLGFFFALLAMHATLRHWDRAVKTLAAVAPLQPEHTRTLLEAFRRAGRTTLLGTLGTGAAQGALAALGYWITGVPEPLFFGIATAIVSIGPVVGTLLVWVPAGAFLMLSGQLAWGIVELLWGLLVVVGFSDYVIRPRLVGDEDMPVLLTFLGLFGGLEVLGVSGLVVGPVLMSVAVVTLRLYARETRARRPAAP